MDYIALGKRIREERCKLNLTQEKLAEDVDLTPAYIGQIERGERKVTLEKLVAIVNRLGVTVDYVISDSLAAAPTEYDIMLEGMLKGRSPEEKLLITNILKAIFDYKAKQYYY